MRAKSGFAWLVFGALLVMQNSARAAPSFDCAPVGHLPTYGPNEAVPKRRVYAPADFTVQDGDDTKTVTIVGPTCQQTYYPKDGTEQLSDLEIQSNYRHQLATIGATTLWSDDNHTVAKLTGRPDSWILISSAPNEIDITVARPAAHPQTLTSPSGRDWKLLGHMPNYGAGDPEHKNYDKLAFTVQNGDDTSEVTVMGEKYIVSYALRDGAQPASELDIQENYRTALQALRAEILFTDGNHTTARMIADGRVAWISVFGAENEIDVAVLEEKPFQLSIQAPRADALKASLDAQGHVALYINFDFGKADIRPESQAVIAQVVKLLLDNPELDLAIQGHTDDIGTHDYNMNFSAVRAQSVMAAVMAAGVGGERLSAAGFGPDQPIADNASPDGRAMNRRVELVKK